MCSSAIEVSDLLPLARCTRAAIESLPGRVAKKNLQPLARGLFLSLCCSRYECCSCSHSSSSCRSCPCSCCCLTVTQPTLEALGYFSHNSCEGATTTTTTTKTYAIATARAIAVAFATATATAGVVCGCLCGRLASSSRVTRCGGHSGAWRTRGQREEGAHLRSMK